MIRKWLKWQTIRRNLSNDWAYRHKHGRLFITQDRKIKGRFWIEAGRRGHLDVNLNTAIAWLRHITDNDPDLLVGIE